MKERHGIRLKKRLKKIIRNCPYLIALLVMWLFLTIGGIGLIIYRDYGKIEWKTIWTNPLFAVVMDEEIHENAGHSNKIESVMAKAPDEEFGTEDDNRISDVTDNGENQDKNSNYDITNQALYAIDNEMVENEAESTSLSITEQMDNLEEETVAAGSTIFETYEPVETNSIYFKDAGKVALTTRYDYTKVDEAYFEDAAFLGDSRTMGISDYAGLDADFYCENGMTIYKLLGEKGVTYQKTGEKVDLTQVLQQKKYGKIYIMLGMNELGYRNTEYFLEEYRAVLTQIRQWQPQAIIFIMANLHVSQAKNNLETEFNNININSKNAAAASLADGRDIFYLDSNPLFTDENGLLKEELTFDGVHLYANNYPVWKDFLMEHGVVRTNSENNGKDAK